MRETIFACAARLLPLLLLLALPAAVQAQFNYTTDNGTITITGYTGPGGAVTIPSTINGLPVTSIGYRAFMDCTSLTSVTIPNSVTSIGEGAFYYCPGLTSVTIPNSVTDIGGGAFGSCLSLTNVTIPNSVTTIGGRAFYGCTSLMAITVDAFNSSYSSVDGILFNKSQTTLIQCPAAKAGSYTIPNGVTSIGEVAFGSCTRLTGVTIPNSVTSIGNSAFWYCPSLTSVMIPSSVTNIVGLAFGYCTSLSAITVDALNSFYSSADGVLFNKSQTTLIQCPGGKTGSYTIPNSVTSIGYSAFYYCTSLTSVTIPNSVTSIGGGAFGRCSSLTSVTIPNSVTSIGGVAFWYCTSLTSITIPNSVTSIGSQAFQYCTSLAGVYFQGNAPSADSSVFDGDNNATVYYLPGTTGWTNPWQGRPTVAVAVVAPYISNVRASQRAGTQLVDVYYDLAGSSSALTVSVAVSTNGGASYTLGAGNFTGAVGAGIAPGSNKKITWNAGVDLPAKLFSNVRVSVTAAFFTGISPLFTVDTRVGGIAVSGRVLDAASRAPISGAAVTLAGQNSSSSGAGLFSFASVSLSSGNTLAVSKGGYATYTGTVPAPAGATAVAVPDILLQVVPVGNKPVVTGIRPKYDGIFLSGAAIFNEYTATVDWAGHSAGSVEFKVNGTLRDTVTTTATEATASINMGLGFYGSLTLGANEVTAIAVSGDGTRSAPFDQAVRVIPMPAKLDLLSLPFQLLPGNDPGYEFKVQWPSSGFPASALMPIPWFDKVDLDLSLIAELKYQLSSGQWEFRGGLKSEAPKLSWGGWTPEIEITPEANGTATQTGGFQVDQVGMKFRLDGKYPILTVYVADLVPGGQVFRVADVLVLVGVDVNSIQRINVNGLFRLDADLLWSYQNHQFQEALVTPGGGLQALYNPSLFGSSVEMDVTGRLNFPLRLTQPVAWKVSGEVSFGFRVVFWGKLLADNRWILLTGDIASSGNWGTQQRVSLRMQAADGTPLTVEGVVLSASEPCPRPMDRSYLQAGAERFVGNDSGQATKAAGNRSILLASDQESGRVSTLDAFRSIGRTAVNPVANKGGIAQPQNGPVYGAGPQVGQADLPLLENVFPGSAPAMAGRGQDLMLLYVTDNGSPNNLQFTDIKWTWFDGTNWSVPATIHTNTQAEFSPQVAYDGNGDAIAVWERVADPNFNQTNLTAMAAQMEIVWSKWNHTSGQWSVPQPLTTNGYLDHAPLLCGPMNSGTVLATWTANTSNLLMGTNGAGSQVLWAQWNPASQSWSSPQTLLADLPYRLSQSLSGVSNRAVYAWTRDLDGVLTNAADQQVFYSAWSNGVWGTATQFTSDADGNRNARVSVGPDGHSYLVWQSGTNLVLSQDFSTNFTLVRADSQTAGFADYAMTIGPAGNLALLWQEMSQAGSDAHYRVLDPASATWSKDAQLFNDPPLERSFAPVWDDVGNLTVAYNKVEIIYTNKTVELEGGGSVTITNVPQPGRVDLCVTKRRLIKDVALAAGDFTVDAENYLPGAAVTLSATLRNAGDVAVSNAVVAFYDGNPTNGGVLITNVAISGWLEGAATNTVTALWVVPEPATNHFLYAVADPAGALTEFDEANNTQSLSIGGTDLAVSLVSYSAETNGAVRVIAQVQNLGAPSATNSTLAIRRYGNTNALLATVAVPLLEPGRLAQVALDLPAGTQPAGEQIYTLTADETHVTSDVDTNNNISSFAAYLWIDSDGDGIPDDWMMQYFGHATGQAGDLSRAQDSASGDGISNLQKYLTGMNPLVWDNLHFSGYASQPDGQFQLAIFGQIGTNYTLQASTDLVNWASVLNFTCTNAPMYVVDPGAKYYGWRFYRVAQGTLPVMLKLALNSPVTPATNGLGFNVQAPLGFSYVIQASTDLINWQPFTNFISTNSIMFFRDRDFTNYSRRFYRAVKP